MGLKIFNNNIAKKIETVGKEAQSLIDLGFQKINYLPQSNNPLNQEGIKNGFEIINEYNSVGEFGLAFEHILYMVYETEIEMSKSSLKVIMELSKQMNISIDHIQNKFNKM